VGAVHIVTVILVGAIRIATAILVGEVHIATVIPKQANLWIHLKEPPEVLFVIVVGLAVTFC